MRLEANRISDTQFSENLVSQHRFRTKQWNFISLHNIQVEEKYLGAACRLTGRSEDIKYSTDNSNHDYKQSSKT